MVVKENTTIGKKSIIGMGTKILHDVRDNSKVKENKW